MLESNQGLILASTVGALINGLGIRRSTLLPVSVGNGHAPPPSSGSIIGHWNGNEMATGMARGIVVAIRLRLSII